MHIVSKSMGFLAGADGETITVIVRSDNTVHMVTYDLNGTTAVMTKTGPQSSNLVFALKQAANDPSRLFLAFHFAAPAGQNGVYRVLITGSNGGDTFGKVITQDGVPVLNLPIFIDIVP